MRRLFYYFLIIITVLVFCVSCGVKPVPEVSKALMDQTLMTLKTGESPLNTIFFHDSDLVYITANGKISRMNADRNMVTFLYSLNAPLDDFVARDGNTLVLRNKSEGWLYFFDLKGMKEIETPERPTADKLVGLSGDSVCFAKEKKLYFYHYPTAKTLQAVELGDAVPFNMESRPGGEMLVLTPGILYKYIKGGGVDAIELKAKAASPFLLQDGSIYYGSLERELVRFSLSSRKAKWKFKLADNVTLKPRQAGNYIMIIPGDNNIYFFTTGGTLAWWDRLGSTLNIEPVVMKENAAVFLWDKSIKFFDFKKHRVTSYPFNRMAYSNMAVRDEYVYMVTHEDMESETEKPELTTIAKIGNNYGAVIITDPKEVIPMGKSVKFKIRAFNLEKPQFRAKIIDSEGKVVFSEKLKNNEDIADFIWIPEEEAEYRLVLELEGLNKKGIKIEEILMVTDVDRLLRDYYYRLHMLDNNEL